MHALGSKGLKVLGLAWDFDEDTITLDLAAIAKRSEGLPATKRDTLKLLAGIFDPLRIIVPVTVTAKILFQDACRVKSDDILDGEIKRGVEAWIRSLIECKQVTIKRCIYEHSVRYTVSQTLARKDTVLSHTWSTPHRRGGMQRC